MLIVCWSVEVFSYDAVMSICPLIFRLIVGGPNMVSVLKGSGIVISVIFLKILDSSSCVSILYDSDIIE